MKKVVVAGSTGLIGKLLTHRLAQRSDTEVVALVRRPVDDFSANTRQIIVDYSNGVAGLSKVFTENDVNDIDTIACCIGSTMRAAGSKEAFLKIERDIPLVLLEYGQKQTKKPQFIFVSSLGADRPMGFYLETKNSVELAIKESGLPYIIVRPSLLLGERTENRPGEQIAQKTLPALFGGLACTPLKNMEWFKRYRPIAAADVAIAMEHSIFENPVFPGSVLEGSDLWP